MLNRKEVYNVSFVLYVLCEIKSNFVVLYVFKQNSGFHLWQTQVNLFDFF